MQPSFMPWQGFFELVSVADTFIFLDDFQFSVQSWHQRNRLFVAPGRVDWYTVPVNKSASFGAPLNAARTDETGRWRHKMWKRIEQNYAKAPFWVELSDAVREWLLTPAVSLADQNLGFIMLACRSMGLAPQFRLSSGHPSGAARSQRVLELLRWCGADRYYAAKGSFDYMADDGVLPAPDIEVVFQDFRPPPYEQVGSGHEFVGGLSVLDALLNAGPRRTAEMVKHGTPRWLTWAEMAEVKAREVEA